MTQVYKLNLFADYFQVYLEDDGVLPDTQDIWNQNHLYQLLAVYPGLIAVGTARNMTVPVEIQLLEVKPELQLQDWDKVNECSIHITSGKIVVMGCTDSYSEALRINVNPGIYRAFICYGNLEKLSEDGLDGEDYYKVMLWSDIKEGEVINIK